MRAPTFLRGISPGVGGAELVTMVQPHAPSAGLGCLWLQPGLPAAAGVQSWYDWIPANDLGLLKATNGASINEWFGDCSRLGFSEKLRSPKGRLIRRGQWFYGAQLWPGPLAASERELVYGMRFGPCPGQEALFGICCLSLEQC